MKTKHFDRSAAVETESINTEKREISFTFSSEYPVERIFGMENGGYERGLEVLDHSPQSANLARLKDGGAVRDTHWGDQVGVVLDAQIGDDKKGRVDTRFGSGDRSKEIFQDMVDMVRRNVSFRYRVNKYVREAPKEQGGLPIYRAMDWEAIHVSVEPDAADPMVGVGRSAKEEQEIDTVVERNEPEKPAIITSTERDMDPTVEQVRAEERERGEVAVKAAREEAAKGERGRVADISMLAKTFPFEGVREIVDEAISSGASFRDAANKVNEHMDKNRQNLKAADPAAVLGMSKREAGRYSMFRAAMMASGRIKADGIEHEAHQALLARGLSPKYGGFLCPSDVMEREVPVGDRTAQAVGTASLGGYLTGTQTMPMIELLRNKQVMQKLGVGRITGMQGVLEWPRQTGASTAYCIAEGGAPSVSNLTFGTIKAQPKGIGGFAQATRSAVNQINPSLEAMMMADIAKSIALKADALALNGTGSDAQPLGILNVSGIGTFTAAAMTWANLLESESDLATANCDEGTMKFLTTPAVRAVLKAREKATGFPKYLWDDDNRLNGYEALVSNQCPSATIIFADWSTIKLVEFGALELKSRDSLDQTGGLDVLAFYDMDVISTQVGAITAGTSFS